MLLVAIRAMLRYDAGVVTPRRQRVDVSAIYAIYDEARAAAVTCAMMRRRAQTRVSQSGAKDTSLQRDAALVCAPSQRASGYARRVDSAWMRRAE